MPPEESFPFGPQHEFNGRICLATLKIYVQPVARLACRLEGDLGKRPRAARICDQHGMTESAEM
jgi:hypothetical protein